MKRWRCRAKKVSTFLWEIFVRGGRREKRLKSCWWFPGEVLVDRPWEFGESCESGLLLHLPLPPTLHLPSKWPAMSSQIYSLALSVNSFLERQGSKVWKVIKYLENSRFFYLGMLFMFWCTAFQCKDFSLKKAHGLILYWSKDSNQRLDNFTHLNQIDYLDSEEKRRVIFSCQWAIVNNVKLSKNSNF